MVSVSSRSNYLAGMSVDGAQRSIAEASTCEQDIRLRVVLVCNYIRRESTSSSSSHCLQAGALDPSRRAMCRGCHFSRHVRAPSLEPLDYYFTLCYLRAVRSFYYDRILSRSLEAIGLREDPYWRAWATCCYRSRRVYSCLRKSSWSHFGNLISPRPLRGRRGGDWCVLVFLEISADI